jgi:peptide/nickel transport system substrate-binding protein/microcin C transport system substrate-binding protein
MAALRIRPTPMQNRPTPGSAAVQRPATGTAGLVLRQVSRAAWLLALPMMLAAAPAAPKAPAAASAARAVAAQPATWSHAYAAFGQPKYPPGFDHFDYVNPDAPKGGTLYLRNPDRRTNFDKFNDFTLQGSSPAGVSLLMLEALAVRSGDEAQTMYGLLAESMQVAPDRSSITFRLHPKARFSDGQPVTAADVKYSFEAQSGSDAAPAYQELFAGVERCVVMDERTVRFDLKQRTHDMLFTVGTVLRVFSPRWALGPDGKPKRLDQIVSEHPIASGPYTIAATDSGRRIEFRRNPDYWARDLGVRRGFYNFDRIVYRYYLDESVAREAFKAGEFDLFREYSASAWTRLHQGPKWDQGLIAKDLFTTQLGVSMRSHNLNLRRPLFQDRRVREALALSFDIDTFNRYDAYKPVDSVFNNSEFAAQGLPSPGELKLLEPFRAELPPEVFGEPFRAPRTARDPLQLRRNLLKARELLRQAGWTLAADGRLRNAQGEPFEIEFMDPGEPGFVAVWAANLDKLGIRLKERNLDFALFQRRLEEFEFDLVVINEGDFTLPDVATLSSMYGSRNADQKGGSNLRGVKSQAVDRLLQALAVATNWQDLRDAARALDRVVMWNHWQVPLYFAANERASYWNRFGMPAQRPRFFTLEEPNSYHVAWALSTWWLLPQPHAR